MQECVPGSGIGRVGALFPDDTGQIDACRYGAYLDGIDQFDAAFFRISPVEAHLLDPQQRLILETSWRALEDAGIAPERLKDSRTGVYARISGRKRLPHRRGHNDVPGRVARGCQSSRYPRGSQSPVPLHPKDPREPVTGTAPPYTRSPSPHPAHHRSA